jgi:transcription antitermination factor NusG
MSNESWHVLYTMPKSEKKIHEILHKKGIESFLPLHSVTRLWSDRKKRIEVPLFPNYIFVKVPPLDRHEVLSVNGVVRYISAEGRPHTVSQKIIDSIRTILLGNPEVIHDSFKNGDVVRVIDGPLRGLKGILVNRKGKDKLAIRIDAVQQSVLVEVLLTSLERDAVEGIKSF